MEMDKELFEKAKNAKTVEEMVAVAKENNVELGEESAKAYFELLHQKTGEISDEELDNVAGGACYKDGMEVVTVGLVCNYFSCKKCGGGKRLKTALGTDVCNKCGKIACCNICEYCIYKKGLWLCTNENTRKK